MDGTKEDWSMETRTGEVVAEKVSMDVNDSVKVESLSVSSEYISRISKDCCGIEARKVAELVAEDI